MYCTIIDRVLVRPWEDRRSRSSRVSERETELSEVDTECARGPGSEGKRGTEDKKKKQPLNALNDDLVR